MRQSTAKEVQDSLVRAMAKIAELTDRINAIDPARGSSLETGELICSELLHTSQDFKGSPMHDVFTIPLKYEGEIFVSVHKANHPKENNNQ